MTFDFHTMLGSSRTAAQLAVSQKGFNSMKLVMRSQFFLCACVCLFLSTQPQIVFELLNQSLWNLECIPWHRSVMVMVRGPDAARPSYIHTYIYVRVYHGTWAHFNRVFHNSFPPVCMSVGVCPLTLLLSGSVYRFPRQRIHETKNCWTRLFVCGPCRMYPVFFERQLE
jgi:hypothetical protein